MDNNLLTIFSEPGRNNLHFVHRSLLILNKLSKSININEEDEKLLDSIEVLVNTGAIDEYDPVRVILTQVRAFQKVIKESQ